MSQRAIIVGAGPGGLAAAVLLARAGVEVDVFERLPRVGGRTTTWQADGYRFDLGPTFFLYPRILEEIFRFAGAELRDEVEMARLDPQYRVQFEGAHIDATPDPDRMAAEIARISPRDAGGFHSFMDENRAKMERFRPVLEQSFGSWTDLLSPELLKLLPLVRPTRSVDDELARHFRDPRVRLAFTFQAKYLGMSPFRCPSLFSILSHLEYEHGVWHPMGGHGKVMEAMARLAQRHGARIHLDEPVQELRFRGRRITGVVTRTGLHEADAVVVNADFARAMQELVPERLRRSWSDRKIARAKFSCSTYMMYLGVQGEVDLPHHTIYVPDSYERNLDEIERRHVLSSDPSTYVQNACVTDPGQAPEGHSALYVLVPVTHLTDRGPDWKREGAAFRRVVLNRLEGLGVHDIERRIRFERVITPPQWSTDYGVHKGAVFNLAHNLGQMLHLRPRNRFDDIEGMYLVGGGTHPGSGLPVIFESAKISSRLLAEDLGLDVAWEFPETSATALAADVA